MECGDATRLRIRTLVATHATYRRTATAVFMWGLEHTVEIIDSHRKVCSSLREKGGSPATQDARTEGGEAEVADRSVHICVHTNASTHRSRNGSMKGKANTRHPRQQYSRDTQNVCSRLNRGNRRSITNEWKIESISREAARGRYESSGSRQREVREGRDNMGRRQHE